MSDTGDGWCLECGDWFHLDDCGGYNPPCYCAKCQGEFCRSCCEDAHPDEDANEPEYEKERPHD